MDRTTNYPFVLSVAPSFDDLDVTVLPTISVRWNQEMDPTQFADVNSVLILISESNNQSMSLVSAGYNSVYHTLNVVPASGLVPNTEYQVTVKDTVKDSMGRQMLRPYVWNFTVASGAVGVPTLTSPADSSLVSVTPAFFWTLASPPSGALYRLQISTVPEFSPGNVIYDATTSNLTLVPGISLSGNNYWRVSAQNVAGSGVVSSAWSDYRSLFVGADTQASPESSQLYAGSIYPGATIYGISTIPTSGAFNVLAWPAFSATWGIPLSGGTFSIVRNAIDDRVSATPFVVSGTTVVSGNYLLFTPTVGMQPNSRYDVTATGLAADGVTPLAAITLSFLSQLKPIYAGIAPIRQDLGTLLSDVSDSDIYFQIYRASILANRFIYRWFPGGIGNVAYGNFGAYFPSVGQLETNYPGFSYNVTMFTETQVKIKLLEKVQYQRLQRIDLQRSLGDFSEFDQGARFLQAIESDIKELQIELRMWEGEFARKRTHMKYGVKSARYLPEKAYADHYFDSGRRRKPF